MTPRILDLFCCAGGAGMGYHRAGFDVIGVDLVDQPHYPFEFYRADAMDVLRQFALWGTDGLAAIHASPPCQAYSTTAALHDNEYPELVDEVRALLEGIGLPYVIENVQGAPMRNYVKLCGSSFGLGVRRHRLFETNMMLWNPPACRHDLQPEPLDVTGTGGPGGRHRKPKNLGQAREAMGIDWMSRKELSEAIPPAYTEWIGHQLRVGLEHGEESHDLQGSGL